jgi:integrase
LVVHDLRRSGARQLRRAGVPESVVQKIGGWKTAAMFKRYAIVSTADQKAAIEKLEQARADSHDFSHDSVQTGTASAMIEAGKVNWSDGNDKSWMVPGIGIEPIRLFRDPGF